MNYADYTVQDFVSDKYFREWVINPGKESNDFWEDWMIKNPSRTKLVLNARQILLNMAFEEHKLDLQEVLISSLSEAFNIDIERKDDALILKKKNH